MNCWLLFGLHMLIWMVVVGGSDILESLDKKHEVVYHNIACLLIFFWGVIFAGL